MLRRPFALLSLSLVTLALAACSDTTSPTAPVSQRQLAPTAPSADLCTGGSVLSSGKC